MLWNFFVEIAEESMHQPLRKDKSLCQVVLVVYPWTHQCHDCISWELVELSMCS